MRNCLWVVLLFVFVTALSGMCDNSVCDGGVVCSMGE